MANLATVDYSTRKGDVITGKKTTTKTGKQSIKQLRIYNLYDRRKGHTSVLSAKLLMSFVCLWVSTKVLSGARPEHPSPVFYKFKLLMQRIRFKSKESLPACWFFFERVKKPKRNEKQVWLFFFFARRTGLFIDVTASRRGKRWRPGLEMVRQK